MTASTVWIIMCVVALGITWGLYLLDKAFNAASDGKRARVEPKITAAPRKFTGHPRRNY